MNRQINDSTAIAPVDAQTLSGFSRVVHAISRLKPFAGIAGTIKSVWAGTAQRVNSRSAETASPMAHAPVVFVRTGTAPIDPKQLALLINALGRRHTKLMSGISVDALIDKLSALISVATAPPGYPPTTAVFINGIASVVIDHLTGFISRAIAVAEGDRVWDSTIKGGDALLTLNQDIAAALAGAVMKGTAQRGTASPAVISAELASVVGRALAPPIASELFSHVNVALAAEVCRLAGPSASLFGWLMAYGEPVLQERRLRALREFPLLSVMGTLLDTQLFSAVERDLDAGKLVLPALATALGTSEAVLMAVRPICPAMLGQSRLERLFRTDLKSAAAVPVAQLPGCGGVRIDVAWRSYIDACQVAGIGADGLLGTENLAVMQPAWAFPDTLRNGSFKDAVETTKAFFVSVYNRLIVPNIAALRLEAGAVDYYDPKECEAILSLQDAAKLLRQGLGLHELKARADHFNRHGSATWAASRRLSKQHRIWVSMTASFKDLNTGLSVVPVTSAEEVEALIPTWIQATAVADACLAGMDQVVAVVTSAGERIAIAYLPADMPAENRFKLRVGEIVMLRTDQFHYHAAAKTVRTYIAMVNRRQMKIDVATLEKAWAERDSALCELQFEFAGYDIHDNEVADRFFEVWRIFLAPEHTTMTRMEWLEATGIAARVRSYGAKGNTSPSAS